MSTNTSLAEKNESQAPLIIYLSIAWHIVLVIAFAFLSWQIFNMETLEILGKSADLGKPVQYFVASLVLLPALIAILSSIWMLQGNNDGRYLGLLVNFGGFSLSLFALAGIWGFYDVYERIVDMVMANSSFTIAFPIAYAIYWLVGKLDEENQLRGWGEVLSIGLAMLALMVILFRGTLGNPEFESFNIINGIVFVLTRYIDSEAMQMAWVVTIVTMIFGYLSWKLLYLGDYFGEMPDQRNAWQGWLMLAPNIIGFMLFFAGPLLLSFYLSFTDNSVGQVPNFIGVSNYAELLSLEFKTTDDPDLFAQDTLSFGYAVLSEFNLGDNRLVIGAKDRFFWVSMRNTLIFCLLLLPLAVIPAIGMALILNSSLPGVKFFRALYFLPSVAAVVGTALIWRWLYTPVTGYINYAIATVFGWFGLADPQIGWLSDPQWVLLSIIILAAWQVVGYNTVLILAGLQGIPITLYEAAQIDGANRWNQFWNVTLPMLQPTLFFVMITTMVTGLQVFNEPYALFPARPIPENATTSVYYLYTQGFNQFQFGYASSVAWILFAIIFGLTLIQFRLSRSEAYD